MSIWWISSCSLLSETAQSLSSEADKFALGFDSRPWTLSPKDVRSLCGHVEQSTVLILSLFLSLNEGMGGHFLRGVADACAELVRAVVGLAEVKD